jgi:hypothetical protein
MRSGISIICAADVTGFGFVFVNGWYRELVAYRQAATPLWLHDNGFYPASMAVIHEVLSPKRCVSCQRVGRAEARVDGRRATQKQVPPDGEFHRAKAPAHAGNTNVWQAETSVEWSRADRRAYRLTGATASSVAVGPNNGSSRTKQTAIPWTNERLS